ncbi:PEP-CTERM sorting domain-containing protein [Roseiterribacter gracilis]|uniref:Ice-binding protein C-terminal domain-containing protein n=1 Tax=Roseiterribacter gracilis TaxID=2812848 RepID=A0A8S8XC93_9PROT|nr:hypothetical protein TMPK1_15160 [Rhodospirillales bacterium TMPK1]
MHICRLGVAIAIAALFGLATPARAVPSGHVTDDVGVFLSTFTGAKTPDLDVAAIDVRFQGSYFKLTGVMAGNIDTSHAGIYAWGIDRGAGQEHFVHGMPPAGFGVKFDTVLLVNNDGTANTLDFVAGGGLKPCSTCVITIKDNVVTALLPLDLVSSRGLSQGAFTFNLWPRVALNSNADISDFAPDASNVGVPEPASVTLLAVGLLALFGVRRVRFG